MNTREDRKQRAKEKRQKLSDIAKQISKLTEEQRTALVDHWPTTIEGHRISLHNACMIAYQGGATVIGGFRQWKKAGRYVKKGEHGLGIWIPLGLRKKTDEQTGEETREGSPVGFSVATVFDVSQTEDANAANERESNTEPPQWDEIQPNEDEAITEVMETAVAA